MIERFVHIDGRLDVDLEGHAVVVQAAERRINVCTDRPFALLRKLAGRRSSLRLLHSAIAAAKHYGLTIHVMRNSRIMATMGYGVKSDLLGRILRIKAFRVTTEFSAGKIRRPGKSGK